MASSIRPSSNPKALQAAKAKTKSAPAVKEKKWEEDVADAAALSMQCCFMYNKQCGMASCKDSEPGGPCSNGRQHWRMACWERGEYGAHPSKRCPVEEERKKEAQAKREQHQNQAPPNLGPVGSGNWDDEEWPEEEDYRATLTHGPSLAAAFRYEQHHDRNVGIWKASGSPSSGHEAARKEE